MAKKLKFVNGEVKDYYHNSRNKLNTEEQEDGDSSNTSNRR